MDAQTEYSDTYIEESIKTLIRTGTMNLGESTIVRGETALQKVIAAAYYSPFALGGSKHYQ